MTKTKQNGQVEERMSTREYISELYGEEACAQSLDVKMLQEDIKWIFMKHSEKIN